MFSIRPLKKAMERGRLILMLDDKRIFRFYYTDKSMAKSGKYYRNIDRSRILAIIVENDSQNGLILIVYRSMAGIIAPK